MSNPNESNSNGNGTTEAWERQFSELLQERDRLREELAKTKAENDANYRALVALVCKDFKLEMTQEEILAQMGKQPPIEQLIAELEQELEQNA